MVILIRMYLAGSPACCYNKGMDLETDIKEITACMLDVGELLLSNGADVNRVEDTIMRLGTAFGVTRCDVHAINSNIILTLTTPAGSIETQTRRIKAIDTNLNAVESANELSREICGGCMDPAWIRAQAAEIRDTEIYPESVILLGYAMGGAFFTVFFGGSWIDALAAVPIALLISLCQKYMQSIRLNKMVKNVLLSALLSLCGLLGAHFQPLLNADAIIIGSIMLLIPGRAFCNAIRDMVVGDTLSGVLTLFDVLLLAFSIAAGYIIAFIAVGRFL